MEQSGGKGDGDGYGHGHGDARELMDANNGTKRGESCQLFFLSSPSPPTGLGGSAKAVSAKLDDSLHQPSLARIHCCVLIQPADSLSCMRHALFDASHDSLQAKSTRQT